MINIVHPLFRAGGQRGHTVPALLALALAAGPASGAEARAGAVPAGCDPHSTACPGHRPPGPPDRDARPFEGTLGRPCGYRLRFAPSGTRRVRVCF